jgi:hypothetical protein
MGSFVHLDTPRPVMRPQLLESRKMAPHVASNKDATDVIAFTLLSSYRLHFFLSLLAAQKNAHTFTARSETMSLVCPVVLTWKEGGRPTCSGNDLLESCFHFTFFKHEEYRLPLGQMCTYVCLCACVYARVCVFRERTLSCGDTRRVDTKISRV